MSYHVPGSMCVGVMVWFGWGDVVSMQAEALPFCSCGMWGWGLMAVWNNGLVSPGFCSGISLPSCWRVWI